jgi:hypothetical protein
VFFAAVVRTPGAMLSSDQGVMTYVICTGTGTKTITVSMDADEGPSGSENHDLGCDFFAAQIAALIGSESYTSLGLETASHAY